jgi:hypothetical protein
VDFPRYRGDGTRHTLEEHEKRTWLTLHTLFPQRPMPEEMENVPLIRPVIHATPEFTEHFTPRLSQDAVVAWMPTKKATHLYDGTLEGYA